MPRVSSLSDQILYKLQETPAFLQFPQWVACWPTLCWLLTANQHSCPMLPGLTEAGEPKRETKGKNMLLRACALIAVSRSATRGPQGLPLCEADRSGRGALALGHGLDAGAEDLGGVGAVAHGERDEPPEQRIVRESGDLEGGHAEAQEQDEQDQRDAAHDVDEHDRECPDGKERGAAKAARHREDHAEQGDRHHRNREHLDVGPEAVEDRGPRLAEGRPVEELGAHLGPVAGLLGLGKLAVKVPAGRGVARTAATRPSARCTFATGRTRPLRRRLRRSFTGLTLLLLLRLKECSLRLPSRMTGATMVKPLIPSRLSMVSKSMN